MISGGCDILGQNTIGQTVYKKFKIANSLLIKYHSFFDIFEPVFGHKNRMVIRTTQELIMKEVLKKIVPICLLLILSCGIHAKQVANNKTHTLSKNIQQLDIFELRRIEHMGPKFYFTSVSEKITFNPYDKRGKRKTNIFVPDPADNYKKEKYLLTKTYRQRFLAASKISETDTLFIYNYVHNKLYSFPISKLEAFAIKDDYGGGIDETEFQFGFALTLNQLPPDYNPDYTTFVYIGKNNPFAQQQLTLLNWQKINDKNYDYLAQAYGLHYYVTECFYYDSPACGRLVVKNQKNKILFNHNYLNGDVHVTPLNGKKDSEVDYKNQWSGKLFNDKPLAVFGFYSVVFGCPKIDFIDSSYKSIRIKCDNRH